MSTIGNERAEKALADKTRTTFNEAAQGKGGLSEGEKKERPDKATHDHNIEPSMAEKMVQSAARSAATSVGRQLAGSFGKSLVRGILGSLFK